MRTMFTQITANSFPVNAQVEDPGKISFAALPPEVQDKIHDKVLQQIPHRSSTLRNFALVCRGTYNAALPKLWASHLLDQVDRISRTAWREHKGKFDNILQQVVRERLIMRFGVLN